MSPQIYENFLKKASNPPIKDIERRFINHPVSINAEIEDLISKAITQNFIPIVDDEGIFIGIIKRSDIINYCYEKIKK